MCFVLWETFGEELGTILIKILLPEGLRFHFVFCYITPKLFVCSPLESRNNIDTDQLAGLREKQAGGAAA